MDLFYPFIIIILFFFGGKVLQQHFNAFEELNKNLEKIIKLMEKKNE